MTSPLRADQVQPENIEWLWRDRLPKAMLSMIAGRPDQGKSMIATVIAAELTKQGHNVLYSSKERSFGLMEKPRFIAAGGVEKRMFYWRFSLPRQMDELAEYILEKEIDLCVLDPASAHFIGVSMASDRAREVLNPIVELAETTGCAFLFIEHALKRVAAHAHPLTAIRGNSSGLPAACAMAFLFGSDPQNEEHKILACVKHNICDNRKALQFEIDTVEVDGLDDTIPTLVYDEEITFDPIRLLARTAEDGGGRLGRPNEKRAAASEWLTNYLAKAGAPVPVRQITEDAKHFGMTGRTLRRAAVDMQIVKDPVGGGPNTTWWLPDHILELINESDAAEPEAPVVEPDMEAPVCAADVADTEAVDDLDVELAELLKGLQP